MNLDMVLLHFIWKNRQKYQFFTVKLNRVSKSGNLRECSVYIQKNRQWVNVTQIIADISGLKYRNSNVVIVGCNMDMIFALLSRFLDNLSVLLYEQKKIRKMQRGYHCNSSTYYVLY